MAPSFDNWTIIFLFLAAIGIVVSFLFFIKFKKAGINNSLIVLLFSITLIDWTLYWTGYHHDFPHLAFLWLSFCFTYGPLALFYVKKLSGEKLSLFQKLIHFSPFIVVGTYNLFFTFLSTPAKQHILLEGFREYKIHFYLVELINKLALVHLVGYVVLVWVEIRKIQTLRAVKQWSILYACFFSFFVLNFVAYFFMSKASFFNKDWDYSIGFSMVIFVSLLLIVAYSQPSIFNVYKLTDVFDQSKFDQVHTIPINASHEIETNSEKSLDKGRKYKNSPLSDALSKELMAKLMELMKEEKFFLNSGFSLTQLSEKLNLSKHHTSQLINQQLGMSFFEYLNSLRVEEAAQILSDKKNTHKVIDVAHMVGFNNKVSFFNAFKNIKGCTPLEYSRLTKM